MSIEAMARALTALETLAKYSHPLSRLQMRSKDSGKIITAYPHKIATDAIAELRLAIEAPRKEWIEITSEEREAIFDRWQMWEAIYVIEAKLKEKNYEK